MGIIKFGFIISPLLIKHGIDQIKTKSNYIYPIGFFLFYGFF